MHGEQQPGRLGRLEVGVVSDESRREGESLRHSRPVSRLDRDQRSHRRQFRRVLAYEAACHAEVTISDLDRLARQADHPLHAG
jgi:hypothetical protein